MRKKFAFTLVELLVVIAIIGILMALSLPAIQSVRESGRRTQCSNNLMNIAKAFVQHETIHRHLPTGGWGYAWGGDADRGFGRNQSGGWGYNILPYIEENSLHDVGKGIANKSQKKSANEQRLITPVSIYNCPSRRRPKHYHFFNIITLTSQLPKFSSTNRLCSQWRQSRLGKAIIPLPTKGSPKDTQDQMIALWIKP